MPTIMQSTSNSTFYKTIHAVISTPLKTKDAHTIATTVNQRPEVEMAYL